MSSKTGLLLLERQELLAEGLPCSVECHFHDLLGKVHYLSDVTITLFFHLTQQHGSALTLRKAVEQALGLLSQFFVFQTLGRRGLCAGRVVGHGLLIEREVGSALACGSVEGKVATRRMRKGLYRLERIGIALLPTLPKAYKHLLHHIFGLGRIERDTQGQTIEFVFEWQHLLPKLGFVHNALYYNDGRMGLKLHVGEFFSLFLQKNGSNAT